MRKRNILSEKVLVLNKNWQPVSTCTVRKALILAYTESARIVDPKTYEVLDLDAWAKRSSLEAPSDNQIKTARFPITRPEILILTGFGGVHRHKIKFSRKNLAKRDRHTCQYCGHSLKNDPSSVDHIIPKCRGGRTEWTNCVLSCLKCNTKKANKTPKEAGFRLLTNPTKPQWTPFDEFDGRCPESWLSFLNKAEAKP
jgi:5-methylcytosine-specific restriction endonuclease McrA